jgi:hypothetical protein
MTEPAPKQAGDESNARESARLDAFHVVYENAAKKTKFEEDRSYSVGESGNHGDTYSDGFEDGRISMAREILPILAREQEARKEATVACSACSKTLDIHTVYRCASCGWRGCEICFRVHLKEQIAPCHLTRLRELAEMESSISEARKEATAAALGHAWMTVQKISNDYCNDPEHGGIDPETGVWEGTEAQQSYVETLDQAVEAIRALISAEDSDLLDEAKRKERHKAAQIVSEITAKHSGNHACGPMRSMNAPGAFLMKGCRQNMADEIITALSAPQHEKQP